MKNIRYIGNFDVTAEGKFLWELLAQLRHFGVGRLVTKNEWLRRWPSQPSYCIVRKVQPEMDRWLWKGKMWSEWVYRGRNMGVYEFSRDLNRADWRLIHKEEEAEFTKCEQPFSTLAIPNKVPLPPLQRHFAEKMAKREGRTLEEKELLIDLVPFVDPDFDMLRPVMKQTSTLNPPPTGSVYDIDPNVYLNLYGEELPTKVEAWNY
uniref:28S ribosomal protein S34, mitochondrial n=1 Tax=Plectus sambesii TaxID=2011161 RepID=A0A914V5Y6_9BILA